MLRKAKLIGNALAMGSACNVAVAVVIGFGATLAHSIGSWSWLWFGLPGLGYPFLVGALRYRAARETGTGAEMGAAVGLVAVGEVAAMVMGGQAAQRVAPSLALDTAAVFLVLLALNAGAGALGGYLARPRNRAEEPPG
jgi:hypothetical protein